MSEQYEIEKSKFIEDLFEFADKNRVTFHPAQNIVDKVTKMLSNKRSCICKPERICPCKESVRELIEGGKCTCRLFSTYEYGDKYLNKYGYLKDGKVTNDEERRIIVKEKSACKVNKL